MSVAASFPQDTLAKLNQAYETEANTQEIAGFDLNDPALFINRELSLLEFNWRFAQHVPPKSARHNRPHNTMMANKNGVFLAAIYIEKQRFKSFLHHTRAFPIWRSKIKATVFIGLHFGP